MAYKDLSGRESAYIGFEREGAMANDLRALGIYAVRRFAEIPLRAYWHGDSWERVLTTTRRTIALPAEPGAALYVKPGLGRLCAVADENAQSLWDKIIVAGSGPLLGRLREASLGFEELYSSPFGNIIEKEDVENAVIGGDSPPVDLQLVCFDSMDDSTDTLAAADIIRGAERNLSSGGLLVLGGTLHSCVGRQSLAETVSLALRYFEPEYEQEHPLNGGMTFQAVFRK